jgi:Xaa-Pro aminopeptidase
MLERLEKLREGLAPGPDRGEGFFSFSAPANQYLTGFMGSTSAVIVTRDKAQFLCDFRYTEQAGDQVRGFEIEEMTEDLVLRAGERLQALGVKSAAFDPGCVTVAQLGMVRKAFTGALEEMPDLMASMRAVKSAEEIARIRAASELAEGVLADLVETLGDGSAAVIPAKAGITERELAARIDFEFKKRGASGPAFDTIALFGARSSLPHGQPEDAALKPGDIVLLDLGCRMAGYCSDLTRTYVYATIPGSWFEGRITGDSLRLFDWEYGERLPY